MSDKHLNCDYSTAFYIAKTADGILSSTSLLLDRLIKKLNHGKLASIEREIKNLESAQEALSENSNRMHAVIEGIPRELEAIEKYRKFRAGDLLTGTVSYFVRKIPAYYREWGITHKKEKAILLINSNSKKSEIIQGQVDKLQAYLKKLENKKNPSWWSRFLLSIKAFLSAIVGFTLVTYGDFASGAQSLVSAVRSIGLVAY